MEGSKLTKVLIAVFAIGGLGFIGYKLYQGSRTRSQDPDKNNRRIIITKS